MAISASYDSISQDLTVTGDTADNAITVSRNPAGSLLVNNGSVPVTGGTPTVANTDLIAASGDLGNDTIALDEANGALPAASLAGGGGNDALTGGSGADLLFGEAGDDTLLGRGGADDLRGGGDSDTLAGGDGDDLMFGDAGNDLLIWNPGDDTDFWEGGDGSDTGQVNGGNGAEVFTATANGTRVRFDRLDPAPFTLDVGTTESLVVNMNGGDDSFSATGNLAALIGITVDGGGGNDTILGSNGADLLLGGDGNDFVDAQQGNDVAFLGAGTDVFQWDPGDGSDTIEGQGDSDTLLFNASAGAEIFQIGANGARTSFTRNVGNIVMDVNDVESFTLNALAGVDSFTINDLTGTDVTQIALNLAGTIGGSSGDAATDALIINGSSAANTITVTSSGTSYSVSGLTALIEVTNSEGALDSLTINGLGGDDTIAGGTLSAGVVSLTIDGGLGNDTIAASAGGDVILGGDGNDVIDGNQGTDTAFLGIGDDQFRWDPGDASDVVEGQAGTDELFFNGSNASENVSVAANGGRILFSRDVAAITMDLDDVERIRFNAIGGMDNILVNDLAGTDVVAVDVHLTASGGGGDGLADTVTVNSTIAADVVAVTSASGVVTVSGLQAVTSLFGAELANDRLVLNGLAGDDVLDASGLQAGLIGLTINAGLGADVVLGSAGSELVNGGDGNDLALLGEGNDTFTWNPGDDNDTIEGQSGNDTLQFNGSSVAENIQISANGGRIIFFRDVAAVTMDLNDTEAIEFAAAGGNDNIVVNDLAGTDVTNIGIDLAGAIGGASGDALVDTITLRGSGAANTIGLSGSAAALNVTGLPWSVTLNQIETADQLTILAGDGNDTVSTAGIANLTAVLVLDGGGGNDVLHSTGDGTYLGGIGDDLVFAGLTSFSEVINGGDGLDTLDTRTFNSTYTVNLMTGATNFGGESFTNFENLITGEGADTITGTDGANVIRTNGGIDNVAAGDGNDVVNGGAGADTLAGGLGDDWLYVDNAGDVIVEAAGGGTADRVFASVSYTLGAGAYVEILSTTNSAGTDAINLTGNGFVNSIAGNNGANILDGGVGADTLNGLGGNDWLYVDNAGDVVVEASGGGSDRVLASVSYTLGAGVYVELLTTTNNAGVAAINLTGNAFVNSINGNAGANVLNGGAGADTLTGLGGNDHFYVDNAGDTVIEGAGGGTADRVFASVNYTLGAGQEIEILSTTDSAGVGAINLTGNDLVNSIAGNNGANVLVGGAGADTLNGLGGDDHFYVDNAGDVVVEAAGGGTADRVFASVNYALGAGVQVEILSTTNSAGVSAINMAGNELANSIAGNAGANVLDGKGGSDTLNGLGGADTFRFTTALGAGNIDTITGYVVADDVIHIDNAVFTGLGGGVLAAGAFRTGAAAADADDRIIYNSATGALLFDADGNGAGAAVQFATLSAGLAMAAGEFFVF